MQINRRSDKSQKAERGGSFRAVDDNSLPGPRIESSLGFANDSTDSFTPLGNQTSFKVKPAGSIRLGKYKETWEVLGSKILKKQCWSRLSYYGIGLVTLPEDIVTLWNRMEKEKNMHLDAETRLHYFKKFARAALGTSMLHVGECALLIRALNLSSHLSRTDLDNLLHSKLEDNSLKSENSTGEPENNEFYDFEHFASLVCDLLKVRNELEQASLAKRGWLDVFPLDPECKPKKIWDAGIICLLLYSSFAVPFGVAFDNSPPEAPGIHMSSSDALDYLVDLIFLLDIVVTFLSAYDNQGYLVRNFGEIAQEYVRGWFLPDFLGSFPFDKVVTACIASSGSVVSNSTLQLLRLIRMFRLIRVAKLFNHVNRLKKQDGLEAFGNMISLTSTMLLLIFSAHLFGCIFTMLIVDPNSNWLFHYRPHLVDSDVTTRYVVALYWAMITISTMGYGDIVPDNHYERCFAIIVSVIGAVLFSYCLGTISSLISQVSGVDDRFQVKGRAIVDYLRFREVAGPLKRKIKTFYLRCWQSSPIPFQESEILDDLDGALRCEILRQIGSNAVLEIPALQGFDDESIGFIVTRMKKTLFLEGEYVYRRGERAREMYFIVKGNVTLKCNEILSPNGDETGGQSARRSEVGYAERTMTDGETFGELALFPKILGRRRLETAVAHTFLAAYTLSVDEITRLEEEYPRVVKRLRELCQLQSCEWRLLGATTDDKLSMMEKVARPCMLKTRIHQVKTDLIRCREMQVLKKAAGDSESEIFKAYRAMPAEVNQGVQWQSISCVISEQGELLLISHNFEDLNDDSPRSLGYLIPGLSTCKVMDTKETALYGGSSRKELFGCALVLYPSPSSSRIISRLSSSQDSTAGTKELLFTWSSDTFESMVDSFEAWLRSSNDNASLTECVITEEEGSHIPVSQISSLDNARRTITKEDLLCASPKLHAKCCCGELTSSIEGIQKDVHDLRNEVIQLRQCFDKFFSELETSRGNGGQPSLFHDKASPEALLTGFDSAKLQAMFKQVLEEMHNEKHSLASNPTGVQLQSGSLVGSGEVTRPDNKNTLEDINQSDSKSDVNITSDQATFGEFGPPRIQLPSPEDANRLNNADQRLRYYGMPARPWRTRGSYMSHHDLPQGKARLQKGERGDLGRDHNPQATQRALSSHVMTSPGFTSTSEILGLADKFAKLS